ncbi:MAG: hypothetical protein BMS9Abin28_1343 [Anaerolineae bacterium]|nr:MAG: hypothetical protein BMS9Abin28_1343 [Anaerolineae bacterium]
MKRRIAAVLVPTILLLALTGSAAAQSALAVISIGSDSGNPGDTVIVPISLASQGGAQVAGVNFTLSFDGSRLAVSQIDTGSAASAAGKSVSWSPMPTCTGSCSIIVAGLNRNVISDGVIAQVHFDVLSGASSGTSSLTLSSAVATNPSATPIPASVTNGSFQVIPPTNTPAPTATFTNTPTPSNTPTATNTPIPPTPTNSATPGPSPTPSRTPTPSLTPTPSKTSPPTATHTPGPSPTASNTPSGTLTPSATATATPTRRATATRTPTSEGAGEGLELEGAVAATGTALAEFEGAVAATSTALAEEIAARPTDQIVATGPSSGQLQRPELFVAAGLLLLAIVLGGGAAYLIWRRQQA